MNISPPLSLADRIVVTLEGLHRAVAARSSVSVLVGRGSAVLAVWVIGLVCARVRRTQGRLLRMLARFQAGRLVARVPGGRTGDATRAPHRRPSAAAKLPRRLAWLLPLVPCEAANFASQFRLILAEPEMAALLASAPQARRLLAPLCRMLGIEEAMLTPAQEAAPARVATPCPALPAPDSDRTPPSWSWGSVARRVPDD